MTIYWQMNVGLALKFYEECIKRGIADDDIKTKMELLRELGAGTKDFTEVHTKRSVEQVTKDFARHHGKVLHIKGKEEEMGEQRRLVCPECHGVFLARARQRGDVICPLCEERFWRENEPKQEDDL